MKQDEAETILKTTTTKNWQKAWWERQNSFVGHPYHQVPHYLTIRWYFVLSCTTSIALYFIFPLSGLINRTVDGESKNSTDTAVCASLKIELRQNRHQTSLRWPCCQSNTVQLETEEQYLDPATWRSFSRCLLRSATSAARGEPWGLAAGEELEWFLTHWSQLSWLGFFYFCWWLNHWALATCPPWDSSPIGD